LVSADAFSGAMIAADPDPRPPEERARACRALFEDGMVARGLSRHHEGAAGATFAWLESQGITARDFLASYARVFDVTVIGRPQSASDGPRMGALEAALFESGRPVLLAPPEAPASIGDNVLIAWNGTPEAARTVAFAKPLLQRARHVAVVTVAGGETTEPSGEHLARYLRLNGITCEAREVEAAPERGAAFLAEARRVGSDLIVKGAYTQSRLRQMIFGGATRHLVTEATVPVLLAH
ncbi:MAG: universal stress protein, partial [Bacteroidota bacterium]|nr:universal stress protein [Kiloniellaceae bacterium]